MSHSVGGVDRVLHCASPQEAEYSLAEESPHLLLLVDYGDDSTVRVAERAAALGVRVLLLLADTSPASLQRASRISADGYMVQADLTLEALTEAFDRLTRGDFFIPTALSRHLLYQARENSVPAQSGALRLTPREREVLSLLVNGLSNKQIARRCGISQHGVKRHVTNLLAKLNCPNRTMAVAMALQNGLLVD